MTSVVPKGSSCRYKRSSLLPKSNVPRVLLHDNCSQQHLLDLTLSHLTVQQHRTRRHLELRRRTFLTTQSLKQENLTARGVRHVSIVPTGVAQAYSKMNRFYQHNVKRLPPSAQLQEARCAENTPVYTPEEGLISIERSRAPTVCATHSSRSPSLPSIPNLIQRSHTVYRDQVRQSTPRGGSEGTDRAPSFNNRSSDRGATRNITFKSLPMEGRDRAFTENRSKDVATRGRAIISFRSPDMEPPDRNQSTSFYKPPGTPGPQYKGAISGGNKTPNTRTLHIDMTNKTPETKAQLKTPDKSRTGVHRHPTPKMPPTRQKLAWARPKATRLLQDPRFTSLKRHLQSPDPSRYTDSFLTLSDAGNTVLQHHRSTLAAWQQQQQADKGVVEAIDKVKPTRSVFYAELSDSPTSLHYSSESDTEDEGEISDLR